MDTAGRPNTHLAGDAALVERARAGDREAFTALIDARLSTTYRTALAFLGTEADAREATEEIFVRAWRDLPDLPEPDGFGPWFTRIVEDTCRTAASGPRRAIVREISPGTDGAGAAAATGGTLRRQIVERVAATEQRSVPRVAKTETRPVSKSRRKRFAIGIPVIVVLVVLLVALIGQRLRAPETPFRSGLVAFVRDGDVYLANPDGSEPSLVVHQDGLVFSSVAWSPDGRRVAIDGDSGAVVYDTTTGKTTYVGGSSPAWSPDSRRLAVVDFVDVGTRLRIQDVDSGTATTHPVDAIGDLAWSPDGRWIAASGSGDRYSNGSSVLVRLDVETGHVLSIDPSTPVRGQIRQPAWSPDSFRVAFSRGTMDGFRCPGTLLCDTDVFTADPDGTGVVQLNDKKTNADQPAWSPDGRWIAFRQVDRSEAGSIRNGTDDPDRNVGLIVVSPDLTAFRAVDARGVKAFAWGPEGDRLRYVRGGGAGKPATTWEVTVDDGEARPATALGLSVDPAALYDSRVGSRVAWQSVARSATLAPVPSVVPSASAPITAIATPAPAPPADPSETWTSIAIESSDGCTAPTLAYTGDGTTTSVGEPCTSPGQDYQGAWSPTGTHHAKMTGGTLSITDLDGTVHPNLGGLTGLASFSWSPGGTWLSVSGASERIIRVDGSGLRELPGQPTWSPDDSRLFISRPVGALLVGKGDGTGLTDIGDFPPYVVWSGDASRFAFIRDGDVWTAAADGTDIRNVTAFPLGGAQTSAWSPDGRWLAVATSHGAWIMRPDGTDRRGLAFGPSRSIGSLIWAPDSGRVAIEVYTESGQDVSIYLLNVDGSSTVQLDEASGPSWSPDGRYLAVNQVKPSSGGGYEIGNLELMNADGSGRHELPVSTNGNWAIWVR